MAPVNRRALLAGLLLAELQQLLLLEMLTPHHYNVWLRAIVQFLGKFLRYMSPHEEMVSLDIAPGGKESAGTALLATLGRKRGGGDKPVMRGPINRNLLIGEILGRPKLSKIHVRKNPGTLWYCG